VALSVITSAAVVSGGSVLVMDWHPASAMATIKKTVLLMCFPTQTVEFQRQ
jgi:hypothetical protein